MNEIRNILKKFILFLLNPSHGIVTGLAVVTVTGVTLGTTFMIHQYVQHTSNKVPTTVVSEMPEQIDLFPDSEQNASDGNTSVMEDSNLEGTEAIAQSDKNHASSKTNDTHKKQGTKPSENILPETTNTQPVVVLPQEDANPVAKQKIPATQVLATSSTNHSRHYSDAELEHVDTSQIPSYEIPDYGTITPRKFAPKEEFPVQNEKKYTIMIYISGSSLESFTNMASADVVEMINSQYNTEEVNVVILAGGAWRWYGNYLSTEDGAALGYINSTGVLKSDSGNVDMSTSYTKLNEYPLKNKEEQVNMGKPENLAGFLNFSKEYFPAEHYGLILWNHGGGVNRGICFDSNFEIKKDGVEQEDALEISELSQALKSSDFYKSGRKLDFLSCDACLMSNFEVVLTLSPFGEYYVASEETEAGGWDYNFLKNMGSEEIGYDNTLGICKNIAELYIKIHNYEDLKEQQDMNVIDLSKAKQTADTLEKLSKKLIEYAQKEENKGTWVRNMVNARNNTVAFSESDDIESSYDLVDYQGLLKEMKKQGIQVEYLDQNIQDISTLVLEHVDNTNPKRDMNGVSIYLPYHAAFQKNYSIYDVIPSWTVFVEKFSMEYQKSCMDVNLSEAIDKESIRYDADLGRYIVPVKDGDWDAYGDTYWNVFMDNIQSIQATITRRGQTEDGFVTCAGQDFKANHLVHVDNTNHIIEFTDNTSSYPLFFRGMPVDVEKMPSEDGSYKIPYTDIAFLMESSEESEDGASEENREEEDSQEEPKLVNARCCLDLYNMDDDYAQITAMYQIQEDDSIDKNHPLAADTTEVQAYLQKVSKASITIRDMKEPEADGSWKMENVEPKKSIWLELPANERGEAELPLYKGNKDSISYADGILMVFQNKYNNQENPDAGSGKYYGIFYKRKADVYDDYKPWQENLVTMKKKKTMGLKSVSGNSVSENSVSENSVSENSVSENSVGENDVSEDSASGESVSKNGVTDKTVSKNEGNENTDDKKTGNDNTRKEDMENGNSVSGNSMNENPINE